LKVFILKLVCSAILTIAVFQDVTHVSLFGSCSGFPCLAPAALLLLSAAAEPFLLRQ